MIKNLRKRFSMAAILSIFVTFTILMLAINVINYYKIMENADAILTTLKENEGYFMQSRFKNNLKKMPFIT